MYERTGCLGDTLAFKTGFTSLAECQAWCDMRQWQGCGAFVYNSDRNRCYLKRNCDEREIEPDNVSGVKSAVGTLQLHRDGGQSSNAYATCALTKSHQMPGC